MYEGMSVPLTSVQRLLRNAEWIGIGLALLTVSGALFPLLLSEHDGSLTDAARAKLRLLNMPGYVLALVLLAARPLAPLRAVQRNLLLLGLIALAVLSAQWSVSPSLTVRRAIALQFSVLIALLLATRFTPREQVALLGAVIGGCTFASLLAGIALPSLAFMPDSGTLRGIFLHKNVLGAFACLTVILGWLARRDPASPIRRSGLFLMICGALALMLSTSVTPLFACLTAIAGAATLGRLARTQGLHRLANMLALLLLLLAFGAALTYGLGPLLEALGKDTSLTGRVPLWNEIDKAISDHALRGYGYGAFWSVGNPEAWRIWQSQGWQAPDAHNGYRDVLLGIGAPGLLLLLLVSFRALGQSLELCAAQPEASWEWPMAAIIASITLNLSESTFLMQNDLVWILHSSSVILTSYQLPRLSRKLPRTAAFDLTAT